MTSSEDKNATTQADGVTFFCRMLDDVPQTLVRTPQGKELILVSWDSPYLGELDSTPEELCNQVAQKLQTNYDNGQLRYISAGEIDNRPVACITDTEGGSCREPLFTLNPQYKSGTALQRILGIYLISDGAIDETGEPKDVEVEKLINEQLPTRKPEQPPKKTK